jgi:hypothetical protein
MMAADSAWCSMKTQTIVISRKSALARLNKVPKQLRALKLLEKPQEKMEAEKRLAEGIGTVMNILWRIEQFGSKGAPAFSGEEQLKGVPPFTFVKVGSQSAGEFAYPHVHIHVNTIEGKISVSMQSSGIGDGQKPMIFGLDDIKAAVTTAFDMLLKTKKTVDSFLRSLGQRLP